MANVRLALIPQCELVLKVRKPPMPSCPECDNNLDIDIEEVEEGDIVSCDECGSEYEVVGVEPLELARVEDDLDEEEDSVIENDDEEE
jgi:alpha-aminoadipate/glutamate carrier protein LysW